MALHLYKNCKTLVITITIQSVSFYSELDICWAISWMVHCITLIALIRYSVNQWELKNKHRQPSLPLLLSSLLIEKQLQCLFSVFISIVMCGLSTVFNLYLLCIWLNVMAIKKKKKHFKYLITNLNMNLTLKYELEESRGKVWIKLFVLPKIPSNLSMSVEN